MKPETDDSDLPLLESIVAGDQGAFEQLYQKHHSYLFDYLLRRLHDRELAEIALQNLMLAIWRGAAQFRRLSLVRTWMIAIARKQAAKVARNRSDLPLIESLVSSGDDIQITSQHREEIERLRAALLRLPAYEREALELVYYHEMSLAQAAAHLHIPVNTVKSRLYRARTNLRKLMAEDDETRAF